MTPSDMTPQQVQQFMQQAVALSRHNVTTNNGGPFGALVVYAGRVVGQGCNEVTATHDPTAHAEIVAIRAACRELGQFHLHGAVIFTSCEPCPMCLAAIYWARIKHIYFANDRAAAAAIGFDDGILYEEVARPLAQRTLPITRIAHPEAAAVFQQWYADPDRIPY